MKRSRELRKKHQRKFYDWLEKAQHPTVVEMWNWLNESPYGCNYQKQVLETNEE